MRRIDEGIAESKVGPIMNKAEVLRRVQLAYDIFVTRDAYLLYIDANERSLTHKLAEYLQIIFPDWNVDCEYNRDGHTVKAVDGSVVFPDVIIHHRGTSENLVVIEAKKDTTNNARRGDDIEKLRLLKRKLGYQMALAVIFPVEDTAKCSSPLIEITEVNCEPH